MSRSRTRWRAWMSCWSTSLIGTKRIVGRVTASAMPSASRLSFLFDLTYGFTNWGAMSFTSWPCSRKRLAQSCAPPQASMPMRTGGSFARKGIRSCLRQALAQDDLAPLIHSHRVQHALCNVDPEDAHLWFPWARLLWLYGFTDRALIVAHCSRSAQGRVHFITTIYFKVLGVLFLGGVFPAFLPYKKACGLRNFCARSSARPLALQPTP